MKEELKFNSEKPCCINNIKKSKNVYISKMKINLEQKCKKKNSDDIPQQQFKGEIFKFSIQDIIFK